MNDQRLLTEVDAAEKLWLENSQYLCVQNQWNYEVPEEQSQVYHKTFEVKKVWFQKIKTSQRAICLWRFQNTK